MSVWRPLTSVLLEMLSADMKLINNFSEIKRLALDYDHLLWRLRGYILIEDI